MPLWREVGRPLQDSPFGGAFMVKLPLWVAHDGLEGGPIVNHTGVGCANNDFVDPRVAIELLVREDKLWLLKVGYAFWGWSQAAAGEEDQVALQRT